MTRKLYSRRSQRRPALPSPRLATVPARLDKPRRRNGHSRT